MSAIEVDEVKKMIDGYTRWLGDKTVLKRVNDEWVEITTPSLDRHNDFIQIYIRREGSRYLLTDDGYTINDLIISGCTLESTRRKALLDMTLAGFGARKDNNSLVIEATQENFPLKKHSLMQAIMAVNDMFFLSSPHIASFFYDNVVEWLDMSDIRYTPRVKFTGKSGYDHMFDFVIPKSKHCPERLVQLANIPNKDKVTALTFKWVDAREARGAEIKSYVMLNDEESPVAQSAIDAFLRYDSTPIPWSKRANFQNDLAA